MDPEQYDVVVAGGGAAGLSAALVLGRARRQVVVVDAGTPRNAPAAHMHGFLPRDGMAPAELLAVGWGELTAYGVPVLPDEVLTLATGFAVQLASGRVLSGRRVLVATGARDLLPNMPNVRERWGRDLLHCPTRRSSSAYLQVCASEPLREAHLQGSILPLDHPRGGT